MSQFELYMAVLGIHMIDIGRGCHGLGDGLENQVFKLV